MSGAGLTGTCMLSLCLHVTLSAKSVILAAELLVVVA